LARIIQTFDRRQVSSMGSSLEERDHGGRNNFDEMGLLVVNKPEGMTSRALVDRVARVFPRAKLGHAGTLDPLASGVMVVCVGAATRLVAMIQEMPKTYRTVVRLGARSDTCDADGRIAVDSSARIPQVNDLREALAIWHGEVHQVPPEYSALKVKGRRAYELARAGHSPRLTARPVRIDRIGMLDYSWPRLELEIECGRGTYIRSIARDLGETLGCGGYVETLVRTRIGPFDLAQAVGPEALCAGPTTVHLLPALAAVPDLPRVVLQAQQVEDVARGRRVALGEAIASSLRAGPVALVAPDTQLVALGELDASDPWVQPRKVLISAPRILR
jgi:tRNA pseudouridine55 synthase